MNSWSKNGPEEAPRCVRYSSKIRLFSIAVAMRFRVFYQLLEFQIVNLQIPVRAAVQSSLLFSDDTTRSRSFACRRHSDTKSIGRRQIKYSSGELTSIGDTAEERSVFVGHRHSVTVEVIEQFPDNQEQWLETASNLIRSTVSIVFQRNPHI